MRAGHLTVLAKSEQRRCGVVSYQCRCDCGKTVVMGGYRLFRSNLKHCSPQCGLLSRKRIVDLTGKRFGRWTVLSCAGSQRNAKWNCRCDCGTERIVGGTYLSYGQTLSCGCLAIEMNSSGRTPEEDKAVKRERCRLANRKNPARVKANKIKYENKLAKATPEWLTQEHWEAMNGIYEKARRLSQKTGIRHEVDHICPINGERVSGLHVPWNLQILTQAENVAKSNRYAELLGDQEK